MTIAVSLEPIVTERLVLRPVEAAHAEAMWPVLREPLLYKLIARAPPATLSDVEARLRRISVRIAEGRADQWLNWTVWLREQDEAIGIVESTVPPSHVVQIAYMFAPRHWGQGYASEAVRAAMEALATGGAAAFEATIDARNAPSRALAAKLGFRLIETRPSGDIIAGAPSLEEVWRREV